MKSGNDIADKNMDLQLPPEFIVNILADGSQEVSCKIKKMTSALELLGAVGAAAGGCLTLYYGGLSHIMLTIILFVIAVFMLIMMWMSRQKLRFSISDRTFSFRRGPTSGKVAADDIVSLDADQLGENAKSFAVVAVNGNNKSLDLFRYLDEYEAKALLNWIVRRIEEKR